MKKLLVLLFIVALLVLFLATGGSHYFTLDWMRTHLDDLRASREAYPLGFAVSYVALYVLATALSIPGATVLTLAGGALFGFWRGLVLVSFASTMGATLAFLTSRYLLRDWVQRRFGRQLRSINEGVQREGAFYLFGLRLVPLFPFFLVNLVMGLTSMRAVTFFWVSQVGMLAGTLVYVNAGTQLAELQSLRGILSPALLFSFALLGLLPLLSNWLLARIRRRKVYRRWTRPRQFDRNLVVIGAGAAGLVTSYIGATVRARVTLVEVGKMGGDCLNYGCVPSKALIRSAHLAHDMSHADQLGLNPVPNPVNFAAVLARVHAVIRAVEPHDSVQRYTDLGVEVLQGFARILDPWRVQITMNDGSVQTLTTRSMVIATGARPFVPPLPGLEEAGYLTSDTMWDALAKLPEAPRQLVLLGGGPIGCELSQSLARLGAKVTLVERADRVLMREDKEVSAFAGDALQASGVKLLTGTSALRCEQEDGRKYLIVEQAGNEQRVEFDQLIVAVGRSARLTGFGLEELGIPSDRTVQTNEYLETLYPNIFAAGDVAGPYQFTHTAAHMAWYAAVNALFGAFKKFKVDYRVVPWTTFLDPEIARVGLNEQDAEAQGVAVEVTRFDLADLDRALTDGVAHGFIKVLTVPGKDRILGATLVGSHAGELLMEFVLAMKYNLGLNKILGTIHTYPTFSEANKYTAGEWKRAHAPERALRLLERYHRWRRG